MFWSGDLGFPDLLNMVPGRKKQDLGQYGSGTPSSPSHKMCRNIHLLVLEYAHGDADSRNNHGTDIRTANASLTGATCLHGLPNCFEYLLYIFSYYRNHFNWWVPRGLHSLQMEMPSHPFNGNHNCVLPAIVAVRKGADWKTLNRLLFHSHKKQFFMVFYARSCDEGQQRESGIALQGDM